MPNKSLSILSSVITAILLLLLGAVSFLIELVVLNGYNSETGELALVAFGACQGIALILCTILAGRLARVFVEKFNWNKVLAVFGSVFAGALLSVLLGFGSFILSVIVAEAMRR